MVEMGERAVEVIGEKRAADAAGFPASASMK
jgi:hypothetical protein